MDGLRSPIAGVVTVAALVFLYVPLGIVVLFSFHSTGGLSFPFEGVSLRWYREVFGDEGFRDALLNSTIVAVATSVRHARARHHGRLRPEPHLEPPARARRRSCCSCP